MTSEIAQHQFGYPAIPLKEAIFARRSIRGFLDKPVPTEVLESVFQWAQRAPSNCNIQPWTTLVASGETREWLRDNLYELAASGEPRRSDYPYSSNFTGVMRKRQVACAVELYTNMGVGRDDQEGRVRVGLRNFQLFDAPHVAFFCMPEEFGAAVALDVGMYVQTLMLAMTAHGIGSCAQASIRSYPELVREAFGLEENMKVLLGLSFGYEDTEHPANLTRVDRAPLSESVTFKY